MAQYPVTQAEYIKVTGKPNPSHFKYDKNNPVENVSWLDATAYCNQLNAQCGFPKTYDNEGKLLDADGKLAQNIVRVRGFRLPTEAEWEYAARGGGSSRMTTYSGSNDLKEVGWYTENAEGKTHPVGQKKPNELGLHDMSGNVWEWCQDWYDEKYYEKCKSVGTVKDLTGPDAGWSRVARGGCWSDRAEICRTAYRYNSHPEYRSVNGGFRLVFVP